MSLGSFSPLDYRAFGAPSARIGRARREKPWRAAAGASARTRLGSKGMTEKRDNESGSLCPTVKAAAMIGDKWVLLIMREFMFGASRYNDLQRALPRISPTILSRRLKQLEKDGLIVKKSAAGQKATEYRLTRCGRELQPTLEAMAIWGLRWARRRLKEENLDVGSFMWDFHRSLKTEELPEGETVFCVSFPELENYKRWWLIAKGDVVDLCTDDPGRDVDLYLTGQLPDLAEIWMGDVDVNTAVRNESIVMTGAPYLTRSAARWFPRSAFADIRPVRIVDEVEAGGG
jgi:DNA-binding HxlR family transcriptional regulator